MRTIIFCGHLSRFGQALLEEALLLPTIEVKTVVLADVRRWASFRARLKREAVPRLTGGQKREYKKRTKVLLRRVKEQSAADVRIIHDANAPSMLALLKGHQLILAAAFPQIFSASFLDTADYQVINFHPSYLPRCRGAHPIYWTIASREVFGGVSAHFMTEKIDQGPVIAQEKILFDPHSITYHALYGMILQCLPTVLAKTIGRIMEEGKPKGLVTTLAPTYFREDQVSDHKIEWQTMSLEVISAKIRAGNAFSVLEADNGQIRLLPPVTYQVLSLSPNQEIRIVQQNGCQILVVSPSGLIAATFRLSGNFLLAKILRIWRRMRYGSPDPLVKGSRLL